MDKQLDAQRQATASKARYPYEFRVAHVDGRVSDHRTFAAAERSWRVGDVVYLWREGRWNIWTSAGLFPLGEDAA